MRYLVWAWQTDRLTTSYLRTKAFPWRPLPAAPWRAAAPQSRRWSRSRLLPTWSRRPPWRRPGSAPPAPRPAWRTPRPCSAGRTWWRPWPTTISMGWRRCPPWRWRTWTFKWLHYQVTRPTSRGEEDTTDEMMIRLSVILTEVPSALS